MEDFDARNELVTAVHTLASHFERTLCALRDDAEALAKAKGDIAHALKAAKDAAFERAANLLECEYAEDTKQKRRLDQIAQHIRDLKKSSS